MTKCDSCEDAYYYHEGIMGAKAHETKTMLVLNCPDKRILEPALPGFDDYEQALRDTDTGKNLGKILVHCKKEYVDFLITNFYKCLLPEDRKPNPQEYRNCLQKLEIQISEFKPEKIILFGGLPYEHMFPQHAKTQKHEDTIGKILSFEGIQVLISAHPSMFFKRFKIPVRKELLSKFYDFINPE